MSYLNKDKEYYESKRINILKRLQPIADAIGIKIDYVLDYENGREYLSCNDQNICTNHTNIYGIENEFWGYVSFVKYERNHAFAKHHKNAIRTYWYDENFEQPYARRN